MVLFLAFGLTVNAHASLIAGTYDLISLLGDGSWNEILLGGHGRVGNTIYAGGPGWALSGTLQSVAFATSPWQYQSTYQITFAVTVPGAWAEAVQISNVPGTNLSKRDINGQLEWLFTFTGYDAQNPSIPIKFTAQFDSIPPTNPISGVLYYNDNQTLHGGSPLSQLTMQVVPIPAPGWLLGAGLLGLVGLSRRFKK